jgi:hypothetical protein
VLVPAAQDPVPRLVTDMVVLDRENVAGADKLGNLFVLNLPLQATAHLERDQGMPEDGGEERGGRVGMVDSSSAGSSGLGGFR